MLPPRHWPTSLWVATAAVGLLLVHAIGLAVQLALVQSIGGIPDGPDSDTIAPVFDTYQAQIIAGLVPGLAVLGVGLYAAITTARRIEPEVAWWGRIFVIALAAVAGALVLLALPWYDAAT